jgi:hypothetical protein
MKSSTPDDKTDQDKADVEVDVEDPRWVES